MEKMLKSSALLLAFFFIGFLSIHRGVECGNVFSGGRQDEPRRGGLVRQDSFDETTLKPPPIDPDLITLSEDLFRLDQQNNAAKQRTDWAVNTRSTNGRLFTKFSQAILSKPTYAALVNLLDKYRDPVLGTPEQVTPDERQAQSTFLDRVLETPVMKRAWQYLTAKKLAPSNLNDFKKFLQMMWFTVYRRRGTPDTSGFEHVFAGELSGRGPQATVAGFHSWIRYVIEESAGRIEYLRWKGQLDPNIYGMQFNWNGAKKIKTTLAIGESPEMSMAVFTTCFLAAPNTECKLRMGGAPVSVVTHKWTTNNPNEFYVASAYYDN